MLENVLSPELFRLDIPFRLRTSKENFNGEIRLLLDKELEAVLQRLVVQIPEARKENVRQARLRRLTMENISNRSTHIHFDNDCINFLCYLELPEMSSRFGTHFYQHPVTGETRGKTDLPAFRHIEQDLLCSDHYLDRWKVWHSQTPKPGLSILFDGHLFHSGPLDAPETPRLTLEVSFLRNI